MDYSNGIGGEKEQAPLTDETQTINVEKSIDTLKKNIVEYLENIKVRFYQEIHNAKDTAAVEAARQKACDAMNLEIIIQETNSNKIKSTTYLKRYDDTSFIKELFENYSYCNSLEDIIFNYKSDFEEKSTSRKNKLAEAEQNIKDQKLQQEKLRRNKQEREDNDALCASSKQSDNRSIIQHFEESCKLTNDIDTFKDKTQKYFNCHGRICNCKNTEALLFDKYVTYVVKDFLSEAQPLQHLDSLESLKLQLLCKINTCLNDHTDLKLITAETLSKSQKDILIKKIEDASTPIFKQIQSQMLLQAHITFSKQLNSQPLLKEKKKYLESCQQNINEDKYNYRDFKYLLQDEKKAIKSYMQQATATNVIDLWISKACWASSVDELSKKIKSDIEKLNLDPDINKLAMEHLQDKLQQSKINTKHTKSSCPQELTQKEEQVDKKNEEEAHNKQGKPDIGEKLNEEVAKIIDEFHENFNKANPGAKHQYFILAKEQLKYLDYSQDQNLIKKLKEKRSCLIQEKRRGFYNKFTQEINGIVPFAKKKDYLVRVCHQISAHNNIHRQYQHNREIENFCVEIQKLAVSNMINSIKKRKSSKPKAAVFKAAQAFLNGIEGLNKTVLLSALNNLKKYLEEPALETQEKDESKEREKEKIQSK